MPEQIPTPGTHHIVTVHLLVPMATEASTADYVSETLREGFPDWEYVNPGADLSVVQVGPDYAEGEAFLPLRDQPSEVVEPEVPEVVELRGVIDEALARVSDGATATGYAAAVVEALRDAYPDLGWEQIPHCDECYADGGQHTEACSLNPDNLVG